MLQKIVKRSHEFLLYTKKETSRVLFTINMAVTTDPGPCSRSVHFNLPSTKPSDIKKRSADKGGTIDLAMLESNKKLVPLFYSRIKYPYSLGCE